MSLDSTNQLVVPPFGFITGTPPVIPDYYWNVYSDEERYKFLAVNLQKLADYANALNDEVEKLATTSPEDVTMIKEDIKALQATVEGYDAAIKTMTDNNTAAHTAATSAETKATEALTNSENAVTTANTANTTASQASTAAGEAKDAADAAMQSAQTATSTATAAKTAADGANTTATQAKSAADTATETATTAKTAAEAASKTATAASDKVDGAIKDAADAKKSAADAAASASTAAKDASDAKTAAQTATETANAAKDAADTATETATAASDKVDGVSKDAASAKQSATDAATSAATAAQDASDAKTAAQTATETANAAKDAVDSATKDASDAKTAATAASTTADNALETANKATTTANAASDTATTAQKTAAQASTDAETATTTANTATETANAAKTAADAATETANTAKTTADTAATDAADAKQSATQAKTAAETAQSAAETASSEVTAATKGVTKTFDTVADMKAGNNFTVGETVKTLGFWSKNDGGGADYLIKEAESTTTDDITKIALTNSTDIYAELNPGDTIADLQVGIGDNHHEQARWDALFNSVAPIRLLDTTWTGSVTVSVDGVANVIQSNLDGENCWIYNTGYGTIKAFNRENGPTYANTTRSSNSPVITTFNENHTKTSYTNITRIHAGGSDSQYPVIADFAESSINDLNNAGKTQVITLCLNSSYGATYTALDNVSHSTFSGFSLHSNAQSITNGDTEYSAFGDKAVLSSTSETSAPDLYYGFITDGLNATVELTSHLIPNLPNCNMLGHLAEAYDIITAGYYEIHSFWVNGTHRVEFTDGTGVKYILVFDGDTIAARYSVTPAPIEQSNS